MAWELISRTDIEGVHPFGEAHLQALIGDLRGRKDLPEPAKTALLAIERGFRE